MPQIWMTYDELAALIGCDGGTVRDIAIAIPLDRRKSRDGNTRCKLNPALVEAYLDAMFAQRCEREIDAGIRGLKHLHGQMAGRALLPCRSVSGI